MEIDEILIRLFNVSGRSTKDFVEISQLSRSSVYYVLQHDKPGAKSKVHEHTLEFVRSWVGASRPTNPDKLIEWASLAVSVMIPEEQMDLVFMALDGNSPLIEPDTETETLITDTIQTGRISFLPSILLSKFATLRNSK